MKIFFRDNTMGVLLISVAGSLIATWLAPLVPIPIAAGAWWRTVFFQPIPVLVLFPYSIALVWGFVALMRRWQTEERSRNVEEKAALTHQLQVIADERDALRRQPDAEHVLSIPVESMMRFVAIVLSDTGDSTPKTHLNVCRQVAGLAGPGFQHAAIGDALGAMLQIGAVMTMDGELTLTTDWRRKLDDFSRGIQAAP